MIRVLVLAGVLAAAPTLARAQDPPPAPPPDAPPAAPPAADEAAAKDAEAAKFLKELPALQPKQNEMEAKAAIDRVKLIWKDPAVTAETKKPIPGLLSRYAKDLDKVGLLVASVDALAELGPEEGAKPILEILERGLKAKEPSVDVYGAALKGLRKLADPSKGTVSKLIDLLKHRENEVISKAADAMAGYKDAPGKVRKELLEELIKASEGVSNTAVGAPNSPEARKWNIINFNVMQALRALSGQQFKTPSEARTWFNEHKKDKIWN